MYIMKKINKLQINSDRLMKKEELLNLKGGYYTFNCYVMCTEYSGSFNMSSIYPEFWQAEGECEEFHEQYLTNCTCGC